MKHPDYCTVCKNQKRGQCRATEYAIDGPCPVECHCQLDRGHAGPHECEHGFYWSVDAIEGLVRA